MGSTKILDMMGDIEEAKNGFDEKKKNEAKKSKLYFLF